MAQHLAHLTLLVADYDEAIAFYTTRLGFELRSDTPLANGRRWVLVGPAGGGGCALLLSRAEGAAQHQRVGDQAGGRVLLFLHTDDFWADYHRLRANGVQFVETPRDEPYATVVVFEDLYGNRWDLLQPKS